VFGDSVIDRVLIANGPLGTNNLSESSFIFSYQSTDDFDVGQNLVFGDVNGDGNEDWLFGSDTELYAIFGLD